MRFAPVPSRPRIGYNDFVRCAETVLHDYLVASARRLPDKVAVVCERERFTYAELDRRSSALAQALVRGGVERGDRVVVFMENRVEAIVSFWAVLKANAVVVMVSDLTRPDKLAFYLEDSRASALVAHARLAGTFAAPARRARHLRTTVVAGALDPEHAHGLRGPVAWEDAIAGDGTAPPRRSIDRDLAAIVYTSGSTGKPKGVMLTHRNMTTAATSITTYLENVEDDVLLGALPLAFDYGLYQMIMAFRIGARLVLERSFGLPAPVLARCVEEGVTGFPGMPTFFALLAGMRGVESLDLSCVRYVTSSGATLTEKHVRSIRRLFPRARIYSMYGLTECKRCSYLPPEDLDRKPGSVGIAIPNTELWIVGEDGRRLGPGEVGQLVVRGGTVMRGYWDDPEGTAERLRPGPLPGEMVLHTGDLCRQDEDGYLYFVGRMDDVIKSRGMKVPPKEVEAALLALDGVKEAAVIGVADELLGEAVHGFVVLEPGASLREEDLRAHCARALESFMVPRAIRILPDMPRTSTGKIAKQELR